MTDSRTPLAGYNPAASCGLTFSRSGVRKRYWNAFHGPKLGGAPLESIANGRFQLSRERSRKTAFIGIEILK